MRCKLNPDESGNITLASLFMMMILVVFMVGMIDLGLAWAKTNQQEDLVAVACDEAKTSSTALGRKNASWPEPLRSPTWRSSRNRPADCPPQGASWRPASKSTGTTGP